MSEELRIALLRMAAEQDQCLASGEELRAFTEEMGKKYVASLKKETELLKEICGLKDRIIRLLWALRPFAEYADRLPADAGPQIRIGYYAVSTPLVSDCRKAKEALEA
jgi:hypothetical protein